MAFREFEFIGRIREKFKDNDQSLRLGIGDDTAILKMNDENDLLITTDLMTEDVHFSLDYFSPEDIGWRVLAANLSDIASMGGKPLYFTMSIAIPASLKENDFLDRFLDGLNDCAEYYNVNLIGGDTSSSKDKLFIDIAMFGVCDRDKAIRRSGAKPGNLIYLIGKPGRSEVGLRLFLEGWRIENWRAVYKEKSEQPLMQELQTLKCLYSHLRPQPLVGEGQILGKSGLINSMIDTSDGLSSDLFHICEESKVGAELYEDVLKNSYCDFIKCEVEGDKRDFILNGGEDFLLLFTIAPSVKDELENLLVSYGINDFRNIGTITDQTEKMYLTSQDGSKIPITASGWEHS